MRIAVYVPCFNGAAWIEECVGALLSQTRRPSEVAVVDDGSTDESAAIVRRFGASVRLIQHGRNRGLAVARNTALREIECDVLASVDADVRATPEWLGELVAGFDSPGVGAVGGRLLEAHQARPADRWRAAHMAQHAGDFPLREAPTLAGATMAVRRGLVRSLGGYDESLRTNYEDADLRVRLMERGYRCAYAPDALAHHLRTDTPCSVLRTYWGWLRPPAERRGAFDSLDGLAKRRRDVWERTRRCLWADVEAGADAPAYLSLLMGLAFPVADAVYASQRAPGAEGAGASWLAGLAAALEEYSPGLGAVAAGDVGSVAWWDREREGGASGASALMGFGPAEALEMVPRAWWRRLERGRAALGEVEGWSPAPSVAAPGVSGETVAILAHGEGPRRERLRVTREHDTGGQGVALAAHRLGWLPPSRLQQSLLETGWLVAGDGAALDAIPHWRPERIDPLGALEELDLAERRLTGGEAREAIEAAEAALLIVRRAYAAREGERHASLSRVWPALAVEAREAPSDEAASDYVSRARRVVEDWLFAWHSGGMGEAARDRWKWLRAAARRRV